MFFDPKLMLATQKMFWDAQIVMTLRLTQMATLGPSEMTRMVAEKGPAFARASLAAQEAMLKGKPPAKIARAALRPVARKAKANRKRLTR